MSVLGRDKYNAFRDLKYRSVRGQLRTGDIILFRGNSIMSKLIRHFDRDEETKEKAYYSHIGVVFILEEHKRVFILDMWSNGLEMIPLSLRLRKYTDFCVLRPKDVMSTLLTSAIDKSLKFLELHVKYDHFLLLRIALVKRFGIDMTLLGSADKWVCSEYVKNYIEWLKHSNPYQYIKLITPMDFIRHADNSFDILHDDRLYSNKNAEKRLDYLE